MSLTTFLILALSLCVLPTLCYYYMCLAWRVEHHEELRLATAEHTANMVSALIQRINQVDRLALELRGNLTERIEKLEQAQKHLTAVGEM